MLQQTINLLVAEYVHDAIKATRKKKMDTCEKCGKRLVVMYRAAVQAAANQPIADGRFNFYLHEIAAEDHRGNKSIREDTMVRDPYCPNCITPEEEEAKRKTDIMY